MLYSDYQNFIEKMITGEECLGYYRTSTDEQSQGFSFDYQEKLIKDYCEKMQMKPPKFFYESHSAKKPGRPEFNNMLKYARKHKIKNLVFVCNHRASRNPVDSAQLSYMAEYEGYNIHLIENHLILHANSKPQDFLIFEIDNGFSNLYSRNLRVEVTNKMKEKANQGHRPGSKAPLGYKWKREKKRSFMIVDEDTAPFVRRCFELYSTGQYSYVTLAEKMRQEGMLFGEKTKPGRSNIETLLNNPTYIGDFIWGGQRYYDGKHEAIIDRELYYLCQRVKKSKTSTKKNAKSFLFSHIIKCSCGCTHVGEIKKGKYIYYHCTGNKGGECKRNYLKESYLEELFLNTLDSLTVPSEAMPLIVDQLKRQVGLENQYAEKSLEAIETQIKTLKNRLDKLLNAFLDGTIDELTYKQKRADFETELDELLVKQKTLNEYSIKVVKFSEKLLELFKNARSKYLAASFEKKQELIKLVCSNFYYDGSNLTIEIKKAFQPIVKIAYIYNGGLKPTLLELSIKEFVEELAKPEVIELIKCIDRFNLAA